MRPCNSSGTRNLKVFGMSPCIKNSYLKLGMRQWRGMPSRCRCRRVLAGCSGQLCPVAKLNRACVLKGVWVASDPRMNPRGVFIAGLVPPSFLLRRELVALSLLAIVPHNHVSTKCFFQAGRAGSDSVQAIATVAGARASACPEQQLLLTSCTSPLPCSSIGSRRHWSRRTSANERCCRRRRGSMLRPQRTCGSRSLCQLPA
jgi:hypothetical protein